MTAKRYTWLARPGGFLALGAIVTLAACGGSAPLSPLSTAASMRIEVEVYKGPLSRTRPYQFGELVGVLKESGENLGFWLASASALGDKRCRRHKGWQKYLNLNEDEIRSANLFYQDMRKKSWQGGPRKVVDNTAGCTHLLGTVKSAVTLLTLLKMSLENIGYREVTFDPARIRRGESPWEFREYLGGQTIAKTATSQDRAKLVAEVGELAAQFKAQAFLWAYTQAAEFPQAPKFRRHLTDFTTITSEYSNQIGARADSLLKQIERDEGGIKTAGSELSTADHLRDAGTTDFLRLYDWYRATVPEHDSGLSRTDKVRLAQRLFADHNWTKINEVHGSGQGEVRMAFVKGPIGNWDLKSFDNNPEELLDAYRNLTSASIDLAIRTARAAHSGGATELVGLASQFAQGRVGSASTGLANNVRVDGLHARASADLQALLDRARMQDKAFDAEITELMKDHGEAEAAKKMAKEAHESAEMILAERNAELETARGALSDAQSDLVETQTKIDDLASRIDRTEEGSQERTTLEEQKEDAESRKAGLESTRDAKQGEVKRLGTEVAGLRTAEQEKATALTEATVKESAAKAALDKKAAERKEAMDKTVQEAQTSLNVHRRVIDALKESQVAEPANEVRVSVPASSAVSLPISDLGQITP